MATVNVATTSGAYDVTIGTGLIGRVDELLPPLRGTEKAFVVADARVAGITLAPLVGALARRDISATHLEVPAGESAKSLSQAERLYRALAGAEAHRDDLICALGGGSVGDLAGFVAATYMRGVPFIQIPTSLTAQVDASVGGKTGVNLPEGKNLVGAFHQPLAVVADVSVLASSPDEDYRAGLAEVAKVALSLDPALLDILESRTAHVLARDTGTLETIVEACVRAKARVVADDERDLAGRLVLNYGHTLGHALERLAGFGGRTHGDAVAVGMRFAARLAVEQGTADASLIERHDALLDSLGFPSAPEMPAPDEIADALRMDKKYAGGLRFVLLERIGAPQVVEGVPEASVRAVLASMGGRR